MHYIHIYIYMYTRIHIHMCIYIYIYTRKSRSEGNSKNTHKQLLSQTALADPDGTPPRQYMCIYIYIYVYTLCVYVYLFIYIYIYICGEIFVSREEVRACGLKNEFCVEQREMEQRLKREAIPRSGLRRRAVR